MVSTVGEGRGSLYLSNRYTVTTMLISALKMGSNVSHFSVSLIIVEGQSHEAVSVYRHGGLVVKASAL